MSWIKVICTTAAFALSAAALAACGGQNSAPAAQQPEQQSTPQPATYSNTMPDYTLPQNSQDFTDFPPVTYSNTEPAQSQVSSQNYVYFDDPIGWGDTYVYYWSDANKNMVEWPGVKMEQFEGVWRYNLPEGVEYIIFSNGALQTRDVPYNPQQTNYRLSSQRDEDKSYYVEDWQGNVISSDRVDPKGIRD